jgi:hypothetical protein
LEIARRKAEERLRDLDPATWGLSRDGLGAGANAEVVVESDLVGRPVRARRQDVFDLLNARGRLSQRALAAVRRLQEDIASLHRTRSGAVDYSPRVDRSRDPQGFSDARRKAGARIEAALTRAGPVSARLLTALCEPDIVAGRSVAWRAVVQRETGETLADAQSAILRMACESLADAYEMTTPSRSTGATQPSASDFEG